MGLGFVVLSAVCSKASLGSRLSPSAFPNPIQAMFVGVAQLGKVDSIQPVEWLVRTVRSSTKYVS